MCQKWWWQCPPHTGGMQDSSGRLEESRRGEEEDAATRRWQCCRAVGGRQTTQQEGAEGASQGVLKVDNLTRGGGGRTPQGSTEVSGCQTTGQHNERMGEHDVVGGSNGGGDSEYGSWSSEIGGAPPSMP